MWKTHKETDKISNEKICTWLRKENLKKEIESLLIAAKNNAIRNNYIEAKIDYSQRNINVDYVVIESKPLIA